MLSASEEVGCCASVFPSHAKVDIRNNKLALIAGILMLYASLCDNTMHNMYASYIGTGKSFYGLRDYNKT
jgi:hypothetical protein